MINHKYIKLIFFFNILISFSTFPISMLMEMEESQKQKQKQKLYRLSVVATHKKLPDFDIQNMADRSNYNVYYLYYYFIGLFKSRDLSNRIIVLYGEPDTGKTFFIEKLTEKIGAVLIKKSAHELFSESESFTEQINNLIKQIKLIEEIITQNKPKRIFILIDNFDEKLFENRLYEYFVGIINYLRSKNSNITVIYESRSLSSIKDKTKYHYKNDIFEAEFKMPGIKDRKDFCITYLVKNGIDANSDIIEIIQTFAEKFNYRDLKNLLDQIYKISDENKSYAQPNKSETIEAIYRLKGKEVPKDVKVYLGLEKEYNSNKFKSITKKQENLFDIKNIITTTGAIFGTAGLITAILKCKVNKTKKELEKEKQEQLMETSTQAI